jgi:hypothetical protein
MRFAWRCDQLERLLLYVRYEAIPFLEYCCSTDLNRVLLFFVVVMLETTCLLLPVDSQLL